MIRHVLQVLASLAAAKEAAAATPPDRTSVFIEDGASADMRDLYRRHGLLVVEPDIEIIIFGEAK